MVLLLTLMLATTAQTAEAPTTQQGYQAAVTCASSHMVASVIVGQMGDTAQQADLRKLAENFELVSVGFGETLGLDRPTVVDTIATAAAARIAPLEAMATDPNRQAAMAQWATELNQQLEVCTQFAAKLAAAD